MAVAPKVAKTNKPKAKAKASKTLALTPEAMAILTAFNKAKVAEAKAKEAKALADAQLRELLGEAVEATLDGVVVLKVVSGTNTHFDRELLNQLAPEIYQATLRSTAYTYLKTL